MKLQTNPAAGLIHDELEARGIPAATAARDMAIPRSRLSDLFAGRKGVSADTALRLQQYLGIPAGLLIRLQAAFDLSRAEIEKGDSIRQQVVPAAGKVSVWERVASAEESVESVPLGRDEVREWTMKNVVDWPHFPEIDLWLKEERFEGEFVILDDRGDLEPHEGRLERTSPEFGLVEADVERAVGMFGGTVGEGSERWDWGSVRDEEL